MSTQTILFFAIGVFIIMAIGIVLTMIEFNRLTEEPSKRKDAESIVDANGPQRRSNPIRGVDPQGSNAA